MARTDIRLGLLALPALTVFAAFWLLPMARLVSVGASGPRGFDAYAAIVNDGNYFASLVSTVSLSMGVTFATLIVSGIAGMFLQRNDFFGRGLLVSLLTFPLAFPGVVVGFMVIMLAGRQGLIGSLTDRLFGGKLVFAYSIAGLFLGYLYFSIPRVILTVMAAVEKLDHALEEAARSLGANSWQVLRDVVLPGLRPALISAGAICFATSMGAFGTAFTLATNINVLPLALARSLAGSTVAAAA
jgi:putative spermidine/putrescine transport system permease protein